MLQAFDNCCPRLWPGKDPGHPHRERRPCAAPRRSVDTIHCVELHKSYLKYMSLTSFKQFQPAFIETVSWYATSLKHLSFRHFQAMHTEPWHARYPGRLLSVVEAPEIKWVYSACCVLYFLDFLSPASWRSQCFAHWLEHY